MSGITGTRDVYCAFSDALVDRTHSPYDGISIDFDETGRIVGVEILGVETVAVDGRMIAPRQPSGSV